MFQELSSWKHWQRAVTIQACGWRCVETTDHKQDARRAAKLSHRLYVDIVESVEGKDEDGESRINGCSEDGVDTCSAQDPARVHFVKRHLVTRVDL